MCGETCQSKVRLKDRRIFLKSDTLDLCCSCRMQLTMFQPLLSRRHYADELTSVTYIWLQIMPILVGFPFKRVP